jgi:hydroxymethylglutaryl-CoA reductase
VHPIAEIVLKIMKVESAKDLRELMAAAALAQNFAALLALTDSEKRFTEGHMSLHAKNLARQAGATESELDMVVAALRKKLKSQGISLSDAQKALNQIRQESS